CWTLDAGPPSASPNPERGSGYCARIPGPCNSALGQGSVKRQGETMVTEAFDILEKQMVGRDWVAGASFGIADAALFYATRWAPQVGIELPPNLSAHLYRMKERPAVRLVMTVWGET
ncbi:MAG: glutathione binding-like protein, partial [Janthinobacterium lividum]